MTNREKYIDNASNEELATIIMSKISTMPRFSSIDGFTDAGKELMEWLSQEAEEDVKEDDRHCDTCGNNKGYCCLKRGTFINACEADLLSCKEWIPETKTVFDYKEPERIQLTKKAYEDILARLDKLEKCNRIAEVKEHIEESLKEKTKDIVKNRNMRPMTNEDAEELVNKIGLCAEEVKQMNKSADKIFEELGYKQDDTNINHTVIRYTNEAGIIIEIDKHVLTYAKFERGSCIANMITNKEDKAIHKKIEEVKDATDM